jgi:hypothetical protein
VSVETAGGAVLFAAPLWFNATLLLGKRFDYPDILRRSTSEVLEALPGGRLGSDPPVVGMLSGLLLIAGAVLLVPRSLDRTRT